ncbi:Protein xylosyltransferase [Bertholletia excelsa]
MGEDQKGSKSHRPWGMVYVPKGVEEPLKQQQGVWVSARALLFLLIILTGAFISSRWIDLSSVTGTNSIAASTAIFKKSILPSEVHYAKRQPDSLVAKPTNGSRSKTCPEYFRWIHEDLRPWEESGITKEMVEKAEKIAHVRIVVVEGRVYVKKYKRAFQTRDVFTIWGILQLLRFYPGRLPDLDFMFECSDRPVIRKYRGENVTEKPPVFHYCGSDSTLDIAFPDWSFWGWPELQIKPWNILKKKIREGNQKIKWEDREPYAFWKGNTRVSPVRKDLLKCNANAQQDWGARIFQLNWQHARNDKYKSTDLANQCTHRYKIYVEGAAWSVSEKYILACDSMSLIITPHYYDFFTRSLIPTVHYWPINEKNKCRSIKFAVDWGNRQPQEAQKIGKAGSQFIQEELEMKNVYDYMFYLLSAYGKLLRYKPSVPEGAMEVSPETLTGRGLQKGFKLSSMVEGPSEVGPCAMPPPYDAEALRSFLEKKTTLIMQVEEWEKQKQEM